jgi:hypothetical protein
MRKLILAASATMFLCGAFSPADAKSERGCRAKGTCEPRQASATMKACAAQWADKKSDADVKARGWIAFWSACAKEAKVARTVAP